MKITLSNNGVGEINYDAIVFGFCKTRGSILPKITLGSSTEVNSNGSAPLASAN